MTTINFRVFQRSHVSVKVFDLLGREVATIVSAELSAGEYSWEWSVAEFSSGEYFHRIVVDPVSGGQRGSMIETRKLLLIK